MGIDRTFNVSTVYATCIVIKQKRVLSQTGKENPLFLGPVYLHRSSKLEDYSIFLSAVKAAIMAHVTIEEMKDFEEKITFGSDDEKALVKAIQSVFPLSKRILCSLHLKKNLRQNMIVISFL